MEISDYKFMKRKALAYFSAWQGNYKALYSFYTKTVREMTLKLGYTLIETTNEDGKNGVIFIDPDGKEIYRGLKKTRGWRLELLKTALA